MENAMKLKEAWDGMFNQFVIVYEKAVDGQYILRKRLI